MPSFLPEGDSALASDDERRLLQKWNGLLYGQAQPALTFFPEGTEPKPGDDERRSLIKINELVNNIYFGAGPSFLPEGGTAQASDFPLRSLQKISSVLGATALASDSEQLSYQRIAGLYAASGPSYLPESGTSQNTDSPQRSLLKIVYGAGGTALPGQVTDIGASWSGVGENIFAVSWVPPAVLGTVTAITFQKWNEDFPTAGDDGDGWVTVATITSSFPAGSYFFTDAELGASISALLTGKVRLRYTNTVGVGPWSTEATVADLSGAANIPTVIDGALRLRANDATWHDIPLTGTAPNILLTIDQSNALDPGWRWYAVMEDQINDRFTLGIIRNQDGDYVFASPVATAEEAEFGDTAPLVLTSPDEVESFDYLAGQFAVSFYTDGEGTRLSVDVPAAGSPPAAPSGLTATPDATGTTLAWVDESADELLFRVQQSLDADPFADSADDDPNFNPTAADVIGFLFRVELTGGASQAELCNYRFRVRAENAAGNSAWSAEVQVPPSVETIDLVATISGDQVGLVWTNTGEIGGSAFPHVWRSINGGGFSDIETLANDAGTYQDVSGEVATAIGLAQTILYKIRVTNTGGSGPYSNEATAA